MGKQVSNRDLHEIEDGGEYEQKRQHLFSSPKRKRNNAKLVKRDKFGVSNSRRTSIIKLNNKKIIGAEDQGVYSKSSLQYQIVYILPKIQV